jgi:hypothetical protein
MADWKENVKQAVLTGIAPWVNIPQILEQSEIPFSWLGMSSEKLMHPSMWGTANVGGVGIKSPFITQPGETIQSVLPGGERYETYQQKPLWERMAWESPAMLLPVGGVGEARTALKPTLQLTKTKPVVKALENVAEKLETKPEITPDPIISKLKNLLSTHEQAGKITKNLRKLELSRRTNIAEQIYQRVLKETGDIDRAKAMSLNTIKGKMPTEAVMNPKDFLTAEEFTGLRMKITKFINPVTQRPLLYFEKINADTALNKLLATEELLQPWETKLLNRIFPGIDELAALKTKQGGRAFYTLMDVLNIPRATLASGDLSATFRQGGLLISRFPDLLPGMMKAQLKTLFSPKNWKQIDLSIQTEMKQFVEANPKIPNLQSAIDRLYQTLEPGALPKFVGAKEEMFQTTMLYRTPIIKQTVGKFVKASERSFTAGLNYLRWKAAKNYLDLFIKSGATSDADFEGIIKLVNAASGRGNLPKAMVSSSPLLNAFLFAPRLVWSRFEVPTMMFSKSPAVRKEAIRMMVQFLGAGTAILSLAKLGGAEIETDPRSSDFAKIKIGNTRLDIWTGYVQWARFISQLSTAQRKIADSSKVTEANRADIVWNMLQSKEAPLASIITDLLKGQTFLGEPLFEGGWDTVKRELRDRLTPLFAQDLIDAIETDGLMGAAAALPGAVGAGVVSYPPKPEIERLKNRSGIERLQR